MLSKTIGQLDEASTIAADALVEIEQSGASKKTALSKMLKEQGREIGEVFALLDRKTQVAWSLANASTYFPALCLTDIQSYTDISETNYPDGVSYLRSIKIKFKDGLSGEISDPGVINWSINTNVATLTFTNDADHISYLSALLEDEVVHGGFTNWRPVVLENAIGNINAGEYPITAISTTSRTVSFSYTSANASAATATTVAFYAHRIPGSTTTARVYSARGLSLRGANDDNGYFVAGGLRRRGFMQGHYHDYLSAAGGGSSASGVPGLGNSSGTPLTNTDPAKFDVRAAKTDGSNGTPRTGKETHGPSVTMHLYLHLGAYI